MKSKLIIILSILAILTFLTQCANAAVNSSTKTYLTMDSNWTDFATSPHTYTASGNAAINTSIYKFGGGSGYFDGGSTSRVTAPSSSDWYPNTNYTIAGWIYPTSTSRMSIVGSLDSSAFNGWFIEINPPTTGVIRFEQYGPSAAEIDISSSSAVISTNTWQYISVTRSGNVYTLYVNGASVASTTYSSTLTQSTSPLSLGSEGEYTLKKFVGYIDDFYIEKGYAVPGASVPDREFLTNPASSFTANVTSGQSLLPVSFTNTSQGNIALTNYDWSYTNSSSSYGGNDTPVHWSTSPSPTQTFGVGNWLINETVSNPFGYSSSTLWVNVTGVPPVADFTYFPESGPTPLTVSFTDTSITNITAWNWTFGAANYSSLQNPSYTFNGAGNYSVTLQVTNASGTNSTTKYVLVNSLPDPNLNSTLEYAVTATPQVSNQTPITGTVKLSEVNTNTTWVKVNATWDPTYFGVSDIRVNTSDISGASLASSEIHNGYFIVNVSKGAGMDFVAPGKSLIDFNITMTKYAAPGTSAAFNFTSANSQYYDIGNLSAWNFNHFSGMTTHTGVWGPITASFTGTPTLVSIGSPVAFTDASTGYPDAWSWNFGDGETSTAQNPSHAYSAAGLYSVTETAYMAENATVTNTTTRTDYINVSSSTTPVAAFTGSPTTVTLGTAVSFTDQSTGSPTSWTWNFGDSSGSANQNPTHTYASVGVYNVTLTAANWIGNSTLTKTNYITVMALAPPVANFTTNVSSGQIPLAVQFTDTSTNVPTSWSWAFGDGGTSTSQNPEHTFSTAANWTANLTATNAAGSNTTTGYILATSPSGYNRQDLYMSPEYVLTLTIKDTDGNVIPVVTVSDSDGNIANTTNGVYIHTYPYEAVAIYLSANGYAPRSITYVMNRDRVETVQMTATTTNTQNNNVIYYPTQVEFILYTASGNPLSNAFIAATPLNFTAPDNWTQLLLGINSQVNITGTTVSGHTGTDGTWAAPMLASNRYSVEISGTYNSAAYDYTVELYPAVSPVQLTIPIGIKAIPTSAAGIITYSLSNTSINSTAQYVTMRYTDTSLSTSTLVFWVVNATGGTVASTTYTGSAANSQTFNQTFPVVMGQSYTYGFSADTSNFEDPWINQSQSININYQIGLLGQSPGKVELWLAIAILVMWAAIGSIFFKQVVLIGEPILYWFIAQYFGWLPLTAQVYIVLGVMLTLGALIYIRYKENQIV